MRLALAIASFTVWHTAWAYDIPVDCSMGSGLLDPALDSAISVAQSGTPARVLVSGACQTGTLHQMNSAGSLTITGDGSGTTTISIGAQQLLRVMPASGSSAIMIRGVTITNAQIGAIGLVNSSLYVDDVVFTQNAGTFGGGISATNVPMTIRRSRFANNSAQAGGAIAIEGNGTLDVENTTFTGNTASGNGGAVWASAPVQIRTSLIAGSTATGNGGALQISNTAVVRNSTFTANSAVSGGAIAADSGAALTLANVTVHNNTASTSASAVYSLTTTMTLADTLLSGTCAGFPALPGGTGSIESPGNTCSLQVSNQVNIPAASLMLGALANNGGPTQTLVPAGGSAMIDAGTAPCEPIDQRGLLRNVGACDVGAVEAGAITPDLIFANDFE